MCMKPLEKLALQLLNEVADDCENKLFESTKNSKLLDETSKKVSTIIVNIVEEQQSHI